MRPVKTLLPILVGMIIPFLLKAQPNSLPRGWHLLDKNNSGYYGISLDKARQFIRDKKLKSKPVIVAIIDTGIDTAHAALRPVLWRNPKETAGNKLDDDGNGYPDDIYGWNFLGSKDGKENVVEDSDDCFRIFHRYRSKWEGLPIDTTTLSRQDLFEYKEWLVAKKWVMAAYQKSRNEVDSLSSVYKTCVENDRLLLTALDKPVYNRADILQLNANNEQLQKAKKYMLATLPIAGDKQADNKSFLDQFNKHIQQLELDTKHLMEPPYPYRNAVVKDNEEDINDRRYGNNNIMVSPVAAMHGTAIAGIIGAVPGNEYGAEGVADKVQLLFIRATNEGSEHEKDVALAIHYAVDKGARIINMSFGSAVTDHKQWLDEAISYAEKNSVLIVHAMGVNSSDFAPRGLIYPTPQKLDGTTVNNFISVGASGDPRFGGLAASFTAYGREKIDVFAPGISIYTTAPGQAYRNMEGNGPAVAIVTGLAAWILEYYPSLSAAQLKMVIEKTVRDPGINVTIPGGTQSIPFNRLCKSGGIVNALDAIKLAATVKGERKK